MKSSSTAVCRSRSSTTTTTFVHTYLPFCHPQSHTCSFPESAAASNLFPRLRSQTPHRNPSNSVPASHYLLTASMAASSSEIKPRFSVLFVCLGNICRSPAAEGVFRDVVNKKGLHSVFNIDSAGTIDYHEGNLADPRMRAAAKRRGIEITSTSRPIRPSDFNEFDLICAMDNQNREDILEAFNRWRFKEALPKDAHKKVKLMCSYCKKHDDTEVPDPYYGGPQGFEKVLDLLEDGCESLLDGIVAENSNLLL